VDGFDVLAVYRAAQEAVERARQGQGPTLLVTESYRFEGHYAGEPEVYREKAEVERYRQKDPIPRFRHYLLEGSLATEAELSQIEEELRQEMIEAVEFARQSPEPDPETAMEFIYA
jgi:TPP-dependent pyruvate/acetoin dehydrogenase alpha subunit